MPGEVGDTSGHSPRFAAADGHGFTMFVFAMVALTHLLTDVEAARVLRMSTRQLVKLATAGVVPSIDLGDGELRFDQEDLRAFVDQHRKSAMPPPTPAVAPA